MQSLEVKFLFEGIIFTTPVHIMNPSPDSSRHEFFVRFSTKYLINEFSRSYKFVFENNRFIPYFSDKLKERELIKSIQDGIRNHPAITLSADIQKMVRADS